MADVQLTGGELIFELIAVQNRRVRLYRDWHDHLLRTRPEYQGIADLVLEIERALVNADNPEAFGGSGRARFVGRGLPGRNGVRQWLVVVTQPSEDCNVVVSVVVTSDVASTLRSIDVTLG